MSRRSFIRGYGLVTAQGACAADTWDAILAGRTIAGHTPAPVESGDEVSRVAQLSLMAVNEAVERANWRAPQLSDRRTALVVGSSKGPIEDWIAQIEGRLSPRPIVGVGGAASDVGRALGMAGPRLTLASACASGLQALVRADLLLRSGECDRALVIGAESSLHAVFVATFGRLGVLSRTGACRPFCKTRDGFLLSEAAAAICLEAADFPSRSGELFIDRAGMASDAYHITGIDPQAASLRSLLKSVAGEAAFDLVHAHGTATDSNDPAELAAIDDLIAGAPAIYSHKAAVGHTQGAAGMIGAVLNVMMHERGQVLPNANTPDPLSAHRVTISQRSLARPVDRSLILAAGFGGAMAAVTLSGLSDAEFRTAADPTTRIARS